jgi:hypothetical protein
VTAVLVCHFVSLTTLILQFALCAQPMFCVLALGAARSLPNVVRAFRYVFLRNFRMYFHGEGSLRENRVYCYRQTNRSMNEKNSHARATRSFDGILSAKWQAFLWPAYSHARRQAGIAPTLHGRVK